MTYTGLALTLNQYTPALLLALATATSARVIGDFKYYSFSNATTTASPLVRRMTCGGGLDNPCQDLCTCSVAGGVNCHADPTSRCAYMCSC